MFLTIEISRPFQRLPGWYRCKGVTILRVWWLWFAIGIYPMRYDEMLSGMARGRYEWNRK